VYEREEEEGRRPLTQQVCWPKAKLKSGAKTTMGWGSLSASPAIRLGKTTYVCGLAFNNDRHVTSKGKKESKAEIYQMYTYIV